jgi:hypothetical protein
MPDVVPAFSNHLIIKRAPVIGVDAAPGLLEMARQRNPHRVFPGEDRGIALLRTVFMLLQVQFISICEILKGIDRSKRVQNLAGVW